MPNLAIIFLVFAIRIFENLEMITALVIRSQEVHNEMAPLQKILSGIAGFNNSSITAGILLGNLQQVIRRALKVGPLEAHKKARTDSLWIATARAAMDNFEEIYGNNAEIDRKSIPNNLPYNERTRMVRKMRIEWILKNRKHEKKVMDLRKLIEDHKDELSFEEFYNAYATAYSELSEQLKKRLLTPGGGDYVFSGLTLNKSANKALAIFMDLFVFPEEVVEPRTKSVTQKNTNRRVKMKPLSRERNLAPAKSKRDRGVAKKPKQ